MGEISQNGIICKNILGIGYMIGSLTYMLIWFVNNYHNYGQCWCLWDNDWVYLNPFKGTTFEWTKIMCLLGASLGNTLGSYCAILSYGLAIQAGLNMGVISILQVLSAVFSALFTCKFKKN